MDNVNKNISIIKQISHYCGEITQFTERFGDCVGAFKTDFAYRHACSMCIIHISELSTYLTDDFKIVYDGISWKRIKAMRLQLAHKYEAVSAEKIWNIIKQDIPALLSYCSSIAAYYDMLNRPALEFEYEQEDEDELEQ